MLLTKFAGAIGIHLLMSLNVAKAWWEAFLRDSEARRMFLSPDVQFLQALNLDGMSYFGHVFLTPVVGFLPYMTFP